MSGWTLAPSLVRLRAEIDRLFPNRDKSSDGTLGDPAHASRTSDHNPNSRGRVDALDVDVDDNDSRRDLRSLVVKAAVKHPATNYVISNGRIWSRANGWRTYTGVNAHTKHVHVSIQQTVAAETHARPWYVATGGLPPAPPYRYTHLPLRRGDRNGDVKHAQARLGISADGIFGSGTETAVKAFQKRKGLVADGVIGTATAKVLG